MDRDPDFNVPFMRFSCWRPKLLASLHRSPQIRRTPSKRRAAPAPHPCRCRGILPGDDMNAAMAKRHSRLWPGLQVAVALCVWSVPAYCADITCVTTVQGEHLRHAIVDLMDCPPGGGAQISVSWRAAFERAIAMIDPRSSYCGSIMMSGESAPGDARRFSDFLSTAPFAQRLYLDLQGNDVSEAIAVASTVRQRKLRTIAPLAADGDPSGAVLVRHDLTELTDLCVPGRPCVCAGTCILIWAGGIDRTGNTLDPRLLHDERVNEFLSAMGMTPALRSSLLAVNRAKPELPGNLEIANDRYPEDIADAVSAVCGFQPSSADSARDGGATALLGTWDAQRRLRRSTLTWQACSDATLFHFLIEGNPTFAAARRSRLIN